MASSDNTTCNLAQLHTNAHAHTQLLYYDVSMCEWVCVFVHVCCLCIRKGTTLESDTCRGQNIHTFGSRFSLFLHFFLRLYCSSIMIWSCSESLSSDSTPSVSLNRRSWVSKGRTCNVPYDYQLAVTCYWHTCTHLRSSVTLVKLYRWTWGVIWWEVDVPFIRG